VYTCGDENPKSPKPQNVAGEFWSDVRRAGLFNYVRLQQNAYDQRP
jgi:hypothetical protein